MRATFNLEEDLVQTHEEVLPVKSFVCNCALFDGKNNLLATGQGSCTTMEIRDHQGAETTARLRSILSAIREICL